MGTHSLHLAFADGGLDQLSQLSGADLYPSPVLMRQDAALEILGPLLRGQDRAQLAALPQDHHQGQGGHLLRAVHGLLQITFPHTFAVVGKQFLYPLIGLVRLMICAFRRDAAADILRRQELGMLLRRLGVQTVLGLQVLRPVLVLGPEDGDVLISPLPQGIRKAASGLDPRRVVVQAQPDRPQAGFLLQHPQHGLL